MFLVVELDEGAQIGRGGGDGSGENGSYQWRLATKVEREGWVGWV